MSRVTLKDVAVAAGIHHSAVSRVLRGQDAALRLSESRRREIRDAAARLGYRPNGAAASMVTGRFNSIALVAGVGQATSTLPQVLIYSLTDALAAHDKQLVVARLGDELLVDEAQMPLFLRQHSCDGLLVNYTYQVPAGMPELIERCLIPTIWLNVKQAFDCVHPDDHKAAVDAVRWLVERGHQRIAYVDYRSPTPRWPQLHYSTTDRFAGYQQAMQQAGLSAWPLLTDDVVPPEERLQRMRQLLQQPDRPTAVICYGNEAQTAYLAATSLGLNVPQDLEIVGFSERVIEVGEIPLPTMRLDARSLSLSAVAAVLEKVAQPLKRVAAVEVPFTAFPVTRHGINAPPARTT